MREFLAFLSLFIGAIFLAVCAVLIVYAVLIVHAATSAVQTKAPEPPATVTINGDAVPVYVVVDKTTGRTLRYICLYQHPILLPEAPAVESK